MLKAVIIFSICTCVTAVLVARAMEPPLAAKIEKINTRRL